MSVEPSNSKTKHILVVGAGPCGLLMAALLLQRRADYHVTLVDAGDDLSSAEIDVSEKRSWTIGLSTTGIEALQKVPGLYEKYVQETGTPIHVTSYFYREKSFDVTERDIPNKLKKLGIKTVRNFVVDRNAIVAACTRYLRDEHSSNPNFVALWNTKVLFLDGDSKRVLVRTSKNSGGTPNNIVEERYIHYDYVIGCDGVHSTIRSAMQLHMRDLKYDMSDTFSNFKSIHIQQPKQVLPNSLLILVESLPNITMVGAPQSNGMMNLMIGHFQNNAIAPELLSGSVDEVETYMKTFFKAFPLVDYTDFAKQWVHQDWSTTSQLHCNCYHSDKLAAVIMGDAAHATSPALSLGMNTALDDAQTLNRLLDELEDDWTQALPAFSRERVKEGHALTDLSFHVYALRPSLQLRMFMRDALRDMMWRWFPTRVKPSALTQCMLGYPLSDVYKFATKTKRLQKTRPDNHRIQREHFEKTVGLAQV